MAWFVRDNETKSSVQGLEWNIHRFEDGTVHLTVKGVGIDKKTPSTNITVFSAKEWLEFSQEVEMMD